MPSQPYVIEGHAYDVYSSTALAGVKIRIINITKQTQILKDLTTNVNGYAFDLQEMPGAAYSIGDAILVSAMAERKSVDFYTTVGTGAGETVNLYLMTGDTNVTGLNTTVDLLGYSVGNSDTSTRYIELREVATGNIIQRIDVPANDTFGYTFSSKIIKAKGGIAKIPSVNSKLSPIIET